MIQENTPKVILNVASGKVLPLDLPPLYFLVNVDLRYYECFSNPEHVELTYSEWDKSKSIMLNLTEDILSFLDKTTI